MKSWFSVDIISKRGKVLTVYWEGFPYQRLKVRKEQVDGGYLEEPVYKFSTKYYNEKPSPYFVVSQKDLGDPITFKTFLPLFELKFKESPHLRPSGVPEYK